MKTLVLLSCLLMACYYSEVQAQKNVFGIIPGSTSKSNRIEHPIYFLGGIGLNKMVSMPYFFSGILGCARYDNHFVTSIRYVVEDEFSMFSKPSESVWDLGLLAGPALRVKNFAFSISAGIGLMGCTKRGRLISSGGEWSFDSEYESLNFRRLGFPLDAQLFWTPYDRFGIGIYPYADFNNLESFYGLAVILTLKFKNEN